MCASLTDWPVLRASSGTKGRSSVSSLAEAFTGKRQYGSDWHGASRVDRLKLVGGLAGRTRLGPAECGRSGRIGGGGSRRARRRQAANPAGQRGDVVRRGAAATADQAGAAGVPALGLGRELGASGGSFPAAKVGAVGFSRIRIHHDGLAGGETDGANQRREVARGGAVDAHGDDLRSPVQPRCAVGQIFIDLSALGRASLGVRLHVLRRRRRVDQVVSRQFIQTVSGAGVHPSVVAQAQSGSGENSRRDPPPHPSIAKRRCRSGKSRPRLVSPNLHSSLSLKIEEFR